MFFSFNFLNSQFDLTNPRQKWNKTKTGKQTKPTRLPLKVCYLGIIWVFPLESSSVIYLWCYTGQFATTILAKHIVALLERCCNYSKQCRNNVVTLCCAKNCRCESSRVTSPLGISFVFMNLYASRKPTCYLQQFSMRFNFGQRPRGCIMVSQSFESKSQILLHLSFPWQR